MQSFLKDILWAFSRLGIIGAIIGIILGIASLLFLVYMNYQCPSIDCPTYENLSSEWFPYKENQQLVFSHQNQLDTFVVKEYIIHKDESYNSCVHSRDCQEQVSLKLTSTKNTINIKMQNYENPNAAFSLKINDTTTRTENIFREINRVGVTYDVLFFHDFIIIKNIGITSYEHDGITWNLQ